MTAATTDLYAMALMAMSEPDGHRHWYARYETGGRRSIGDAVRRWCSAVDATDVAFLDRATGDVLDAGCGPGRLLVELDRRKQRAAGLDTSRAAVRLARRAGATVLRRSVFDPIPGEGHWDTVLLADGNVGIGGDPVALLGRCRQLLAPTARVLVELDPPGTGVRSNRVRLERGEGDVERGSWFDWAHVGLDAIGPIAAAAGLGVLTTWTQAGRHFATLVPTHQSTS